MRNLIKLILFTIAGFIILLIIYIFLILSGLEIYLISPIAAIYIPHYPNAQYFTIDSTPRRNIFDTSHTDISFTTKDGKSKVEEYYTTELSKKGWSKVDPFVNTVKRSPID